MWVSIRDIRKDAALTPQERFARQQQARVEAARRERLVRYHEQHGLQVPEALKTNNERQSP